jgi:hypothetical protein
MKGPSQQAHEPRLTMFLLLGAILPERRENSSIGPVQEKTLRKNEKDGAD